MSFPKIAINAQVNPDTAGGVETNIKSLIASLADAPNSLNYMLLGHPGFHERLRAVAAPSLEVTNWPYGQEAIQRPLQVERLKWLRGRDGWRADLFDNALRRYRHIRWKTPLPASRRDADAELARLGVGAVHFTNPLFFDTALPFIIEPWDLQYKHYPEFFDEDELIWRERNWRVGCQRARLVMVATQWVKDDIVEKLGIDPGKIAVIPRNSRLVREPMEPARARELLNEAGAPKRFILYPAMSFPHKNHIRLLRALAILRDEGLDVPLVLSGRIYKPHWPEIANEMKRLGLRERVTALGAVSEELLTALFIGASFMVFPSLFEGLGLPILEAFEHGLPVVAARETCIPEVAGPGAMLFDGKSERDIADAIRRAWTHPEDLEAMRAAGRARLSRYSWDDAVKLTTACYKATLGQRLEGEDAAMFAQAVGHDRGLPPLAP